MQLLRASLGRPTWMRNNEAKVGGECSEALPELEVPISSVMRLYDPDGPVPATARSRASSGRSPRVLA